MIAKGCLDQILMETLIEGTLIVSSALAQLVELAGGVT
ncbi:MAG: hypothetical protein K0S45_4209 [Nitrospira sp.]|jgi:hypothetical protein|nr:hypothetical protein [Nitrospira sp.]MCE3241329.1 hypothetical protein [Deltaproteobacteria bacterium]